MRRLLSRRNCVKSYWFAVACSCWLFLFSVEVSKRLNTSLTSTAADTYKVRSGPTTSPTVEGTRFSAVPSDKKPRDRVRKIQEYIDEYVDNVVFSRRFGAIIASPWQNRLPPILLPDALKGLNVFLAGTSFTREVFFSLYRGAKSADLTFEERHVPSYNIKLGWNKECRSEENKPFVSEIVKVANGSEACRIDRTPQCMLPGPAGLDVETCGFPGHANKTFPGLTTTLTFFFKTYVLTPKVDSIILDAIVRSTGLWGYTPAKFFQFLPLSLLRNATHPTFQVRLFMQQVVEAAGRSHEAQVVVAYCDGSKPESRAFCEEARAAQRRYLDGVSEVPVLIVNVFKITLRYLQKQRFSWPKLGHGYAGAPVDTAARLILAGYYAVSSG